MHHSESILLIQYLPNESEKYFHSLGLHMFLFLVLFFEGQFVFSSCMFTGILMKSDCGEKKVR